MPKITLKWAQTLDGQLADDLDRSQWISGPEERQFTHQMRAENDAVLVGAKTFLADRCKLTVRDVQHAGPQPARVILDPNGRIAQEISRDPSISEELLSELGAGPRKTYLLYGAKAFPETGPFEVIEFDRDQSAWLPHALDLLSRRFKQVEGRPLRGLMVEGGARTLSLFLDRHLANELVVSISPLLLGGSRNRIAGRNMLADAPRFQLKSQARAGVDIILSYRVKSSENLH